MTGNGHKRLFQCLFPRLLDEVGGCAKSGDFTLNNNSNLVAESFRFVHVMGAKQNTTPLGFHVADGLASIPDGDHIQAVGGFIHENVQRIVHQGATNDDFFAVGPG